MNQPKRRGRPPKLKVVQVGDSAPETLVKAALEGADVVLVEQPEPAPVVISQDEIDLVADWAEFAKYVRGNGDWIVKATFPGRVTVIDTIWRGVPVLDGPMQVMDADSKWHDVQR